MSKRIKRSWTVALAVRVPRKVKRWIEAQAKKSKKTTSGFVSGILQGLVEAQEVPQ